MTTPKTDIADSDKILERLHEVTDPEIPVLNVVEMGIVRGVQVQGGEVLVRITPTYSGCPAMKVIEQEIEAKLREIGVTSYQVQTDFSEVWTTDWMTGHARQKLKDYGIAPPEKNGDRQTLDALKNTRIIPCPYCDSLSTERQSEFGSTPCKSQYYCHDCREAFEHFKCI